MIVIELVANLVTIALGVYGIYEVVQRLRGKGKPNELDPPNRRDDPE